MIHVNKVIQDLIGLLRLPSLYHGLKHIYMHHSKFLLAFVSILFFGCKSNVSPIPGIKLGMEESEWKNSVERLKSAGTLQTIGNDSTEYKYKWKLADTSIVVKASFNGDGLPFGNLRIIYLRLTSTEGYTDTVLFRLDTDTSGINLPDSLSNLPDEFIFQACLKNKFDLLKQQMEATYSRLDSISYEIQKISNGFDTSGYFFHFHKGSTSFILWHSQLLDRSRRVPYYHYEYAGVIIKTKNYDSDFNDVLAKRAMILKPSDIFTCNLSTDVIIEKNERGISSTYLSMNKEISSIDRMHIEESRQIIDMKGKIIITDKYDQVLNILEGIDMNLQFPIAAKFIPGITYLLGNGEHFRLETQNNYGLKLNVYHNENSKELINAIRMGEDVYARFEATVIKFEDGTIIKNE